MAVGASMSALSWPTMRLEGAVQRVRPLAERAAGSVRSAVAKTAVIIGGYTLLIGSVYCEHNWRYRGVSSLLGTASGFSFLTAIMNMAIIFGVIVKKDKILHYILCAAVSLYLICVPLSICIIGGMIINGYFDIPLWEMPRLAVTLLHLAWMYCLLQELDGGPLLPSTQSPASGDGEGWLGKNLASVNPPPPAEGLKSCVATEPVVSVHSPPPPATPAPAALP